MFHLGELFCGPGGLAWGALQANVSDRPDLKIKHAWANDFDEDTCITYRRNISPKDPESVICEDVHNLDLLGDFRILQRPFDAFAFGFPCNDFSQVGERKGLSGKYGPLYTYGLRALHSYQPLWFLAENVSGLTTANDGYAFRKILHDMESTGYRVYPHLYEFEKYGIPQARHRIIIVGIREDQKDATGKPLQFFPPVPTTPREQDYKTCKEALEKPPIRPDAYNNEPAKITDRVRKRMMLIGEGENAFNAPALQKHPELQLHVKGATISQIYRRLDSKRPSYTVTGSGGGGTHIYHWSEPRELTNRERARLQTFPDSFEFFGPKEKIRRQIGMAVPCEGARQIFEAVLKTFGYIDYPHLERCNISVNG